MNKNRYNLLIITIAGLSILLTSCSPLIQVSTTQPAVEEMDFQFAQTSEPATQEPVIVAIEEDIEPTKEEPAAEEPTQILPSEEVVSKPEPFWNVGKRQAVAAAIDRKALVDQVFEGHHTPAYHMVPPGYPYATQPFLDKYGQRDLDLAISLLKREGYTVNNPFVIQIWYPPEHYGTATADVLSVIKQQLEETGLIEVVLQSQDWADYVESFINGALPFFILVWFPDFVDPDNLLNPFGSCEQSSHLGINYCSSTLDPMLAQAAASTDQVERGRLYQEIGDIWSEDIPTLPLYWDTVFLASRDGIEGINIGPTLEFNYHTIRFGEGAEPASGKTDTLIIGSTSEINSLDAQDAYALNDWEILKNTGVSLMSFVPGSAELISGAAADFPQVSEDGTTYIYTLKEGITYADGTPLTAQDYVKAWERMKLNGNISGLIRLYVESVKAPDDQTVVYNLKDALGFFPALSATTPFIPSNPNQFPVDRLVRFPEEVDGIGPYRMVSNNPGDKMVLEENSKYFGKELPYIPNVIVRYFTDASTLSGAMEAGEIDIAWRNLGADEAARLEDVEGVNVRKIIAPALRFLVFNHAYLVGGE